MSWQEFEDLTPLGFNELAKRRNVSIRYDRYANALTASAVYNVHRTTEDTPIISAFDFVRDEKEAAKLERMKEAKRYIKQTIGQLPMTTTREKYLDSRRKMINDLIVSGHANAEELFDSVWASLKPTEKEKEAGY